MSEERVWGDYSPEDYKFPELYVEEAEGGKCIWVNEAEGKYYREPREDAFKLCLVPYEEAWMNVIDPVKAEVVKRSVVVIPWEGYKGLYLKPGLKVKLVEAAGIQVSHVGMEGQEVKKKSVLAYILTGKGETRTLRAEEEGVIALVLTDLAATPPRYAYVIISPGDTIWLEPGQ